MKITLAKSLVNWLQNNEGKWNKAALVSKEWKYHNSYKRYSPETVGRTLRTLAEEGVIGREEVKGQTWYWGTKPKKIEYERVMVDGVAVMRPRRV